MRYVALFTGFLAFPGRMAFAAMGSLEDQLILAAKGLCARPERILGITIQYVGTALLCALRMAHPAVDLERQRTDPSTANAVEGEGVARSAEEPVEVSSLDDDRLRPTGRVAVGCEIEEQNKGHTERGEEKLAHFPWR